MPSQGRIIGQSQDLQHVQDAVRRALNPAAGTWGSTWGTPRQSSSSTLARPGEVIWMTSTTGTVTLAKPTRGDLGKMAVVISGQGGSTVSIVAAGGCTINDGVTTTLVNKWVAMGFLVLSESQYLRVPLTGSSGWS